VTEPAEEAAVEANDLDLEKLDEIQPGAWVAPGEQVVVSDKLLIGRRFVHRVSPQEHVAGWLEVVPDFAAIAAFNRHFVTPDGGAIEVIEPSADTTAHGKAVTLALKGPDGWLAGADLELLAAIQLDGHTLTLTWEPPTPHRPNPAPVIDTFQRLGSGRPVPVLDLVLHLLIDHPEFGTGEIVTPIHDLLAAADLVVDGTTVRRANRGAQAKATGPAGVQGVDLEATLAAEHLLGAVVNVVQGTPVDLNLVVPALANPTAVAAMAEQVVGAELVTPEQLELLVEGIGEATTLTGLAAGGLSLLRSRLAEWRGETEKQEQYLEAALAAGHSAGALVDAATFAADRGDARGALAHLRTAAIPADDPDIVLLTRYAGSGPRTVGRNDPCWCGSGRKYKTCHIALNGWDIDARAEWIHDKAIAFLQRPPQRTALLEVAMAHAGVTSGDEAPARVIAAACDAIVTELCLAEGGIFDRFVETRGSLLPEDELALARSWVGARHGLWHVSDDRTHVHAHGGGEARALDRASAERVPAGATIFAVVHQGPLAIPGPVLILDEQAVETLEALIPAGDAAAIAAVIGQRFGWTAAPDVGSAADLAPDVLTTTP
jgi:hypothetical protein